jgi:hypothetical protein
MMSDFTELSDNRMKRRDFLRAGSIAAGVCLIGCESSPAQTPNRPFANALEDPKVVHGPVTFPSGDETIDGYLARPKAHGKFPVVMVIAGNKISDEYT